MRNCWGGGLCVLVFGLTFLKRAVHPAIPGWLNQVYSAWLFSYSSPVLCVGTDLGFISTRKLITADEINLRPLLFIFLVLKVTLFIIFYSIFHVAKTAHRRKRYFMKKQRQLSVFKSTDPVFNYRYDGPFSLHTSRHIFAKNFSFNDFIKIVQYFLQGEPPKKRSASKCLSSQRLKYLSTNVSRQF